jgi:zinc protease
MKKLCLGAITLCFLVLTNATLKAQDDLSKPIPFDPSVKTGTLANGLKYYIKKNGKPEKRCELRLALNAGSMLEKDDQQGLAHFVEHMCFNGTKNFKKSALVDFLESAGVKFGAHLNAYTSFDETVYMLQLPTDKEDIFTKGFQVLEDWAHNVTFDADEIEKERGVVISERRGRLGAGERMRQQWWPTAFEGSRYANRLPIGTIQVLEGFKHESLKDFYNTWYRPELMAVCAVGDFDVDKVEALIKEKFSRIEQKPNAAKHENFEVPDHKGLRVAIASDNEATQTTIQLNYKHPLSIGTTLGDMRKGLIGEIFNNILGTRFDELISKGGTPFSFAYSGYSNYVRTKNGFQSFGMVKETGILEGLRMLLTENERAKKHGFNQGEMDRSKKEMMTYMEKSFKERDKTESGNIVQGMVSSFLESEPMPDVAFQLEFYKKYLDGITLEEVNVLGKKWILEDGNNATCVIQAPRKSELTLPTEDDVKKVFEDIKSAKIEPLVEEAVATQLMTNMPKAGSILSEKKNAELGITELVLSNGAKVVYKPTTFKNDEVLMSAYSPGGYTLYPVADNDNGSFASFGIAQSGLGELDAVQLQRYMTGKIARISPYISELFEGFNGSYSPKDEETAMQMLHLYFTAPRKDEKMFKNVLTQQRVFVENMSKSPEAAFRDSVMIAMYKNHPRRQPFKAERLDKVNIDRAYEIYKDRFADAGDFTFFFTGNVEEKKFRTMVETYIASLPTKGRKETWKDPAVEPLTTSVAKNIQRGIEPKSTVQMTYIGDFKFDRRSNFEMAALVKLLSTKLREKIREEKGGTYGVQVMPSLSKFPKERYQLTISFGCAPEKVVELMDAALKEVEDIVNNGSDEKNMTKIKETFLRERETDMKENRFWSGYIAASYQNGLDVMDMNKYNAWVNALTGKDLKKFAKKYIKNGKLAKFTLKPENKA